jgi:hypothetical protein
MKVKALKHFSSTVHGNVSPDDIIDVSVAMAQEMEKHKMVEVLTEKKPEPKAEKETKPLLSSQAAPASQKETTKKRTRRKHSRSE